MKAKRCAFCREEFTPVRPLQRTHLSPACALGFVQAKKEKAERRKTIQMRRELLDNDRKHWIKKATEACNKYIRSRDRDYPCISCGRHHGGQYHAGHFRPSGVNSALRFHALNIHKQCAPCNNHKSGNLTGYRAGLVEKIGIEAVEWLEANHETKRWTVDELKEIYTFYKQALKALEET